MTAMASVEPCKSEKPICLSLTRMRFFQTYPFPKFEGLVLRKPKAPFRANKKSSINDM